MGLAPQNIWKKLGTAVHICNLSTGEAEKGGTLAPASHVSELQLQYETVSKTKQKVEVWQDGSAVKHLQHKSEDLSSIRKSHTGWKRTNSTGLSPDLCTCTVACPPSLQHTHTRKFNWKKIRWNWLKKTPNMNTHMYMHSHAHTHRRK